MQGNNKLRVFSGNTSNYIADADLDGAPVQTGAVNGGVAASNLYNSLSLTTTLACTSLIDFVAQYNPSVTFGQTTPIETWIIAVGNAIASKVSVDNIVDGTTPAANATNVTTNINGKAISTIFESNGTTVKNATNATNVNITNLDNGNNAVVNFQLGNGTSYDKTINNVANANTVQNVDFSSPNSATFGNYTIQKRQVLWSGTQNISDNNSITLTNGEIAEGDILEIIWGGITGYPSTGQRVDRFKVIELSTSGSECVLMGMSFYGTDLVYLGSATLYTSSSTTIGFNNFRYFAIEGLSAKGPVQTRIATQEVSGFYVYEIAKII